MATFLVRVDVVRVNGWQYFHVEARNEREALEQWHRGEHKFVDEEIEVTELGEPDVVGEED